MAVYLAVTKDGNLVRFNSNMLSIEENTPTNVIQIVKEEWNIILRGRGHAECVVENPYILFVQRYVI